MAIVLRDNGATAGAIALASDTTFSGYEHASSSSIVDLSALGILIAFADAGSIAVGDLSGIGELSGPLAVDGFAFGDLGGVGVLTGAEHLDTHLFGAVDGLGILEGYETSATTTFGPLDVVGPLTIEFGGVVALDGFQVAALVGLVTVAGVARSDVFSFGSLASVTVQFPMEEADGTLTTFISATGLLTAVVTAEGEIAAVYSDRAVLVRPGSG